MDGPALARQVVPCPAGRSRYDRPMVWSDCAGIDCNGCPETVVVLMTKAEFDQLQPGDLVALGPGDGGHHRIAHVRPHRDQDGKVVVASVTIYSEIPRDEAETLDRPAADSQAMLVSSRVLWAADEAEILERAGEAAKA